MGRGRDAGASTWQLPFDGAAELDAAGISMGPDADGGEVSVSWLRCFDEVLVGTGMQRT